MSDKLANGGEVLFRQVHPSFIHDGEPSSQPFLPTAKDDGKLSVDRSTLTSAEASHALFTRNGHRSAAVYGLTVSEFGSEQLDCFPDPLEAAEGQFPNPAHAHADYSPHPVNQHKVKAKRLKQKAVTRGRLYPVPG